MTKVFTLSWDAKSLQKDKIPKNFHSLDSGNIFQFFLTDAFQSEFDSVQITSKKEVSLENKSDFVCFRPKFNPSFMWWTPLEK